MSLALEDMELIRQLKYRYFRCIDTANLRELRELFADDADLSYDGGSYRISVQGLPEIIEFIANAFHSEAVSYHLGNHPEITVMSPTDASGIWYLRDWFMDLRRKLVTEGTALYSDRYVKQGGRWLIQHSGYLRIFEMVSEMKEPPNLTAHYLGRHGRRLPAEDGQIPGVEWSKASKD